MPTLGLALVLQLLQPRLHWLCRPSWSYWDSFCGPSAGYGGGSRVNDRHAPDKYAGRSSLVWTGLDPKLAEKYMAEGKLPALKALADGGSYQRLATTFPAMSPVAWSSFATGVNPAKHGIFDFLTRDPRSYKPDLSSAEVAPPRRHLRIGNLQIPLGKAQLKLLRKSRPFWDILGCYRIPCSILRVTDYVSTEAV